jgi:enoyl-CoA hydratase/carnithine racemase
MRRFCLTGETFSAATAMQAGLIHEVIDQTGLDAQVTALAEQMTRVAPQAARDTKALLRRLIRVSAGDAWKACVDANLRARLSAESQEGVRAFRERRTPVWGDSSGEE